jgi:hypothetical protein
MLLLAIGLIALAVLVFIGRYARRLRLDPRLVPASFAVLAAIGAVAGGLRGAWVVSVVLIGLAVWLGRAAARVSTAGQPASRAMQPAEARSVLGVSDQASAEEIEAAFRRLMLRAHPDHGGSSGLAAQLNAARACLIKKK